MLEDTTKAISKKQVTLSQRKTSKVSPRLQSAMFKANLHIKSGSDNPSICAHVCVSDFMCMCKSSVYECMSV